MTTSSSDKLRIVVLISGSGTNLQALIDARDKGELPAELTAVISNRPEAVGLQRAAQAGIETDVLDHKQFPDRISFDRQLMQVIDKHQPGLVVLAGYMRILSDEFVRHYTGRMLNIHPSLLPKYKGLNTHQRALESGDRIHGCSIHFVTETLDGGPVIIQAGVTIDADDDAASLARKVQQQEHIIYPMVVRWFAEGRLSLQNDQPVFDQQVLESPIQLSELS